MQKCLSAVLAVILVFSVPISAYASTGIWTCRNGHENPADNLFCGKCGEAKPGEGEPWFCSNGHENTANNLFCGKCGEAKPEEAAPWVCSSGHENVPSNVFCTACGEKRSVTGRDIGEKLWKEAFEKEAYETALPLVQEAADKGDVEAIAALAMYEIYGYVDDPDYEHGFDLAQQAADAGNARGMFLVGRSYANGTGVSRNYVKALEWYQKAADLGDVWAADNIGYMYENGKGVPQDYVKAMEYYRNAAELGDSTAMFNIGAMYERGNGVSQDYVKALEWYRNAAELGDSTAMFNIGLMYENGKGTRQDYTKAKEWYKKAANNGNIAADLRYQSLLGAEKKALEPKNTKAPIISDGVTYDFLIGYWSSRNGMHTFEMKSDYGFITTVPVVPRSGNSYDLIDGVIYKYFANNPGNRTANLKITKISDTEIEIYSYQTQQTYTLLKRR